jgi:hypothetical protein
MGRRQHTINRWHGIDGVRYEADADTKLEVEGECRGTALLRMSETPEFEGEIVARLPGLASVALPAVDGHPVLLFCWAAE